MANVVSPVVESLTGHIKKHLGYAICSTRHVKNMEKRKKVLENRCADVKKLMERNIINGKEIPTGVDDWLNDVEDLKKKVQSIPGDRIGCLNMFMRYQDGRKACEYTEEIEELITTNSGFNWSNARIPTGRVNSQPTSSTTSMPSPVGYVFKSRDKPFNDALKFLQQDNTKSQVIALCGMGGIGKTTMMEQLKVDKNVTKLFDYIVKVVIGRDPNMQNIQNDIALYLGGEGLLEATQTFRADNLCTKFKTILEKGKKKILVILDDVWEKVNLQDIGLTSPLPEGVKLLLTSRNSNICKQIAADARSTFQEVIIDVLEEAEAKKFFFEITEVLEDDHDKYLTGCNIVKKCGCLPLAIKLIASTLKSQEDYVWSDTLNRLNNNDLDDNVKEIVKISYEYIKDENKEIFLLCGLFPEDANIPIEDLMRYAWGLKLFKKVPTLKEARQRTYTCVSKLINANLLISSDHVRCVKLHDIVLAFVLGEVSKEYYACLINHGDVSKWDEDEIGESCKKISLTCRGLKHFPRHFKYPNLSLLQLMHGDESLKFSENFYENMENLEVIAYYEMSYPLLPRSLKCSTNLKALCLHSCKLMFNECSFIGDLVNLEVLSFAHCAIRKLPATIANLKKLKLLDLTGCVDLHIDDGVLDSQMPILKN
ncbi:putative P-loop containing nucleoside triphosphate hydrolase, leucine-rich repeat domain superfamily [Helianthus annuus]|uniref:P-loop containing nucleoside triphosphate hydrolase, leucine-rich repeat domain superfamily n=1 Tax=Helianthus annuus TaxID=4232 RepID=A0A9K3H6P0_HELAN|nr:putative P-loop containing nucleoside triphosphate hydrolase, leucine-rich repeat domain superfamily [Helianthus annuus]KAJ0658378.1 putative P-loop containing nucleoside triphosphate hydrolase, leucine-rich repeat domain superfamily [Helianthus annuus]